MEKPGYLRWAASVLTGLWVTTGVAVPIGFALLTAIKAARGGMLGPELLGRPTVVLALLGSYVLAAMVGGWAAAWITLDNRRGLVAILSASHVATWLIALLSGSVPFPGWLILLLAGGAILGTVLGVDIRARQVASRSTLPPPE